MHASVVKSQSSSSSSSSSLFGAGGFAGSILEIALGHDIGHTPFGHDGERYLTALCHEHGIGYFLHNVQSVQFLDRVERRIRPERVEVGIRGDEDVREPELDGATEVFEGRRLLSCQRPIAGQVVEPDPFPGLRGEKTLHGLGGEVQPAGALPTPAETDVGGDVPRVRLDQAFLAGLAQPFLERRVFLREFEGFLQLAERVAEALGVETDPVFVRSVETLLDEFLEWGLVERIDDAEPNPRSRTG